MLTKGDDFPIHQTPEPIAYAGTDRNFYDRYFFNGYAPAGEAGRADAFFACAFGVYPHLNVADAAFVVVRDGVETALHASRHLNMERMDLQVGPVAIEVLEPLQRLRVSVDAPEQGLRAELIFDGRAFPIEEPRFIRRQGPRTLMDVTRLTQNGRWTGWIELDGRRESADGFWGTRDRSWGVRPIGARDPQETPPAAPPQFYWIWAPASFESGSFFFHVNEDAAGRAWNKRAVWVRDGASASAQDHNDDATVNVQWRSGTRHADGARVTLRDEGGERVISYRPRYEFFMLGLGYGHPKWGHGMLHGPLTVEREDFRLADLDRRLPQHLHVQALCEVTYRDPSGRELAGRGVLEQLVIGPHAPSGFTDVLDMAR